MKTNRLELAEGMFYNYLDINPAHIPSLFNSARVSILLNKYDQAQLQLNKLFEIDPNNKPGMELQRYINQNKAS
jgi:tetratricopeptide (TPR) repeat protein